MMILPHTKQLQQSFRTLENDVTTLHLLQLDLYDDHMRIICDHHKSLWYYREKKQWIRIRDIWYEDDLNQKRMFWLYPLFSYRRKKENEKMKNIGDTI